MSDFTIKLMEHIIFCGSVMGGYVYTDIFKVGCYISYPFKISNASSSQ